MRDDPAPLRGRARRLAFGLMTVLGLARRGIFIPHRYAASLPAPGSLPPYPAVEALLAAEAEAFARVLDMVDRHADALARIGAAPPPAPRWRQAWFPRLDAAVAYALVRELRPARIVEVGSGHSTRFLARAVADGGLATRIVAIDPAPRAAISALAPIVECVPETVQRAPAEIFRRLAPGDVLFVDSSHILVPGSDVDLLLNRVLPALPAGVIVHVHDVFLPDDYPAAWGWRGYNEQQGIAAFLLGGGGEVMFASRWVATRLAGQLAASAIARLPRMAGAVETSLWFRKSPPPRR